MSAPFVVALEGIDPALDILAAEPGRIDKATQLAINRGITRARAAAAREMRSQVKFPAAYLTGENARLRITQRASAGNLEATLTGRQRPTSLARFSKEQTKEAARKAGGVHVQIHPGAAKFVKNAFIVRLRRGADELGNVGVAIRVKPGETLRNKKSTAVKLSNNVFLLYGPSVDQVFRTVREDIAPDLQDFVENEIKRLLGSNVV